jgi:hypothetical protein
LKGWPPVRILIDYTKEWRVYAIYEKLIDPLIFVAEPGAGYNNIDFRTNHHSQRGLYENWNIDFQLDDIRRRRFVVGGSAGSAG